MFDEFFEKIGLRSTNGVPPGGDDHDENRRSTRGRVSDRIAGVPPVTRALFARIASADARAVALALVLVLSVPAMAIGSVGATATTQSGAIEISTVDELQAMNDDLSADYVLVDDIDASETATWNNGAGFEPIGPTANGSFMGSLDGNGHEISGLTINRPDENHAGLFASSYGDITDVNVTDADIVGNNQSSISQTAILVAELQSATVENVTVEGTVEGHRNTAGLIGLSQGSTVTNVSGDVSVTGEAYVGGLIGDASSTSVSNAEVSGSVEGTYERIGGLVGYATLGEISDSSSSVDVTGEQVVGGLVGETANTDISQTFAKGDRKG
ncbi:GLUG motif-containing protein [Halomontanus rarus]|uniref:GLUG motif-containing protein n=1 Tax=Halomontanus rarus TaxID=3034020 RepID=UPI0023E83B14|nr:GLUG motif-containing protein [Halovivax sp. TS33]